MPKCFNVDVNIAIRMIIMHCPSAKANKSPIENIMLLDTVASAIILASSGDEHGLAARAKTAPTKNGRKNVPPAVFCGIFLMIAGKCKSSAPTRFNPNISIIDANIRIATGEATDINALPVNAHITPIRLNTQDNPKEKDIIWINSFLFFSLEYPPTYPIIRGNIPRLQGDSEAIIPAIKLPILING